ncbi:MAG: immunity 17 family protein [Coprobacter sp.]|nr:immunity 17 family protein [Coprobacter sp.]
MLDSLFDNIETSFGKAVEYIRVHPKSGYLLVVPMLLVYLAGLIFDWRWTWNRPEGWFGNFWLNLLGPVTYRFWQGVIVGIAFVCAIVLYFLS